MNLEQRISALEAKHNKPALVLSCHDEPSDEQQLEIDAAVKRGQVVVLFRERGNTCRLYIEGETLDG